jgi:NAD(P)-dependent dehydrogenase (short-subunit alcohol dehydrogenase family)
MGISFDGRVAIVTGAGGGLGRQRALVLVARGAKVVVNDFARPAPVGSQQAGAADAVVAEIRAAGGAAFANDTSVTDEAAVDQMVRDTRAVFGRVGETVPESDSAQCHKEVAQAMAAAR